ncbi:MAG TPA: iron-sulfur cluster assembly scaffold protein [Fimbriimonadaceae bacterium]|nr:iron-sulfur cluster assembly scaffold protein [Fimbriimonadaceae bacterium]
MTADRVCPAPLWGPPSETTHIGEGRLEGDGRYLRLWLVVQSGLVIEARFQCHGCQVAIAVGQNLCAALTGRELARVRTLERNDIAILVGPVPEGKEFNYELAAKALAALKET